MKLPLISRPSRLFGLVLGCALAGGVALAAWAANDDAMPHRPPPAGAMVLPHGPRLDRLLDDVQASPAQRDQAHQILDAAAADLAASFGAGRADRDQMRQLFAAPTVDGAAIEAVRERIEARREQDSRRATQAMIDVAQVLDADQRRRIVEHLVQHPPRPDHGE